MSHPRGISGTVLGVKRDGNNRHRQPGGGFTFVTRHCGLPASVAGGEAKDAGRGTVLSVKKVVATRRFWVAVSGTIKTIVTGRRREIGCGTGGAR